MCGGMCREISRERGTNKDRVNYRDNSDERKTDKGRRRGEWKVKEAEKIQPER